MEAATEFCVHGDIPVNLDRSLAVRSVTQDSRLRSASVGEHSREEVARRAGVDPAYVDRLVELGILRPGTEGKYAQGDVRRARWVHNLERAGVPLNGMATAVRDGTLSFSFLDAAAFDPFAEVSGET